MKWYMKKYNKQFYKFYVYIENHKRGNGEILRCSVKKIKALRF
jgi:hypothetical protein